MTDLVVIENPNDIDADIKKYLPASPTPGESLYALAIDDKREMHKDILAHYDAAVALSARAVVAAEANQTSIQRQADAAEKLADVMAQTHAEMQPEVFSQPDRLFQNCVFQCVEARARNQPMGTTTSRETVMRDVIDDGWWMGVQLYNKFAAEKGLPLKAVP